MCNRLQINLLTKYEYLYIVEPTDQESRRREYEKQRFDPEEVPHQLYGWGRRAAGSAVCGLQILGLQRKGSGGGEGYSPPFVTRVATGGAINVYTKGGRIWKAQGNPIAGNNRGRMCAKGHGFLHEVYNPDRIRSPLKRVGPNKFEKISWEQAYKEIGEKMLAIKEKHGPESIFWLSHPQANIKLNGRFVAALGSPNLFSPRQHVLPSEKHGLVAHRRKEQTRA